MLNFQFSSHADPWLRYDITFDRLDAFAGKKSDNGAAVVFIKAQQGHANTI
jgi:hypothetical protein